MFWKIKNNKSAVILGDSSAGVLNELIKKLKERYPNRIPNTLIEVEHLRVLQGQQDIINYIQELIDADVVEGDIQER